MKPIAFGYATVSPTAVQHYWNSALLTVGLAVAIMGIPAIAVGAIIPTLLGFGAVLVDCRERARRG